MGKKSIVKKETSICGSDLQMNQILYETCQDKRKQEITVFSSVTQSCLTLRDPMDCSLPDPSVHGIFQGRVLEWGAITFSMLETDPY